MIKAMIEYTMDEAGKPTVLGEGNFGRAVLASYNSKDVCVKVIYTGYVCRILKDFVGMQRLCQ